MELRRPIRHLTAAVPGAVVSVFLSLSAAHALSDGQGVVLGAEPQTASVVLRSADGKTVRLSLDDLKKLPRTELEATDHRGNKAKYSGVSLRVLLDKMNVPRGEAVRGEWMRAFVAVDATDDYRAIFSIAELDPGFTDRTIILADSRDDRPLERYKGPFQMIVPGEKRQARWVRMVKEIRVVDSRSAQRH